jgi:hypothetical protein
MPRFRRLKCISCTSKFMASTYQSWPCLTRCPRQRHSKISGDVINGHLKAYTTTHAIDSHARSKKGITPKNSFEHPAIVERCGKIHFCRSRHEPAPGGLFVQSQYVKAGHVGRVSFDHEITAENQRVQTAGKEGFDCIIGCTDNRFARDIERGVQDHRHPG